MKKLSALLITMILLGIIGCDNEDHPKPDKQPTPSPTVPQPQVK
jgi:hypothetical protein